MVVARGWWRGDGELMFNEYRVPVLGKKKKKSSAGGDVYTTI